MSTITTKRIESIDLLKGLVMVLMALDHTRDYFHADALIYDPIDPALTTLPIFVTRWITNYCAPAFCFLAGISAFFMGRKKEKKELSKFLAKRGIWLIFIELTVVNFAWYFDVQFKTPGFLVIWSLGISMLVLSLLVYLPRIAILIFSCALIFGHNLFDSVHFEGNILWSAVHDMRIFKLSDTYKLYVDYPVIPWIAVMSLGYCFGRFYDPSFGSEKRRKTLNVLGFSAIILFVILRASNAYGDPVSWITFDTPQKTIMSIMAVTKYPPSLDYLLITLGPVFIFLANIEHVKGSLTHFFSTFGRVPFFYYVLHLYLIHIFAMIAAQLTGFGWRSMILADWVTNVPALKGYGFSLWFVYMVWAIIIALLYPLCKWFDTYKQNHKEKEWLSYL